MSLAVVRCLRWTKSCDRLVREYRRYCVFRISDCCSSDNTWLKRSRPVAEVARTISGRLTCWSATRQLLFTSNEVCGSCQTVSIVPDHDALGIRDDEFGGKRRAECEDQASLYLQQLLGIDTKEAEICLQNYRGFTITNPADIPQNYKALRDAGFSENVIKENPEILSYPRRIHEMKIQLISKVHIDDINNAVPFFKLGISTLCLFSNQLKCETAENNGVNRIIYLAKQLQCSTLLICQVLAKHHFMRSITFVKLSQVLKIMLDSQIAKVDIINDFWAFRYNPDMITERLKEATAAGVYPVKPWMIRCPGITLSRRIKKEICRRSVLGDKGTVVEYLSQRFECNDDLIMTLIGKHPKIAQVGGPKLKQVVDFLLENGYTVTHITRVPRVLFHKVETMQERLTELQKYGHKPSSLIVFCKSKKEYNAYLNTIKLKFFKFDKV